MKKDVLAKINNNIDYGKNERIKLPVFLMVIKGDIDQYLLFENKIVLKNKQEIVEINYCDVAYINLSMCSRLYTPGVAESNPVKLIAKRWKHGAPLTVGQHINYCIDFEIFTNERKIIVESESLVNIKAIIAYLKTKVKVVDQLKISDVLTKYPDMVDLVRYLNNIFPKLAKQYDLDNPRGVTFIKS